MSTPSEDANDWAANWAANVSEIAGASGDVDEFARGLSEYWGDGNISSADEYRQAVEGTEDEEKVNRFLNVYERDAVAPGETEIKRLTIVSLTDANMAEVEGLTGAELNQRLNSALEQGGQKWINNTRSALGF